MLLILVGVVGPCMTVLPPHRYFTDAAMLWCLLHNVLMSCNSSHQLPGVFLDNPRSKTVNGRLWPLPSEIWVYASLALGSQISVRCEDTASRRRLVWMVVAGVVALGLAAHVNHAGLVRLTWSASLYFMFSTDAPMNLPAERVALSRSIALLLLLALGGLALRRYQWRALFLGKQRAMDVPGEQI